MPKSFVFVKQWTQQSGPKDISKSAMYILKLVWNVVVPLVAQKEGRVISHGLSDHFATSVRVSITS